jgi:hypothetical protein
MKRSMLVFICVCTFLTCSSQAINLDSLKNMLKGEWSNDHSYPHKLYFTDTNNGFEGYEGTLKIATNLWEPCIITSICKDTNQTDRTGTGYYLEFNTRSKNRKTFVSIRNVTKNSITLYSRRYKSIENYSK